MAGNTLERHVYEIFRDAAHVDDRSLYAFRERVVQVMDDTYVDRSGEVYVITPSVGRFHTQLGTEFDPAPDSLMELLRTQHKSRLEQAIAEARKLPKPSWRDTVSPAA